MTSRPQAGLALMLEADWVASALPLFEADEVEALEWTFDVGWSLPQLPDWTENLLQEFSSAGRLLGHGVTLSLLSGEWTGRQEKWLGDLGQELARLDYQHVSEHFGFMTGGNFHRGAPLPIPLTEQTVDLGKQRMRQFADAAGDLPVGLENLALALCEGDVEDQGRFLEAMLEPVDGFLILDMHNLYCQIHNFGVSAEYLFDAYPLERVREMHISGGSWSEAPSAPGEPIRRDTHDDAVPEQVFDLLKQALPRCPNTTTVIFERLGTTIDDPGSSERFREDFRRMKTIILEVSDGER